MAKRPPDVIITLDGSRMTTREGFHETFAKGLGFPDFYGRNMDAWIDCMSYLGDAPSGMTSVEMPEDGLLVVRIDNAGIMRKANSKGWTSMMECLDFVNERLSRYGARVRIVKGKSLG